MAGALLLLAGTVASAADPPLSTLEDLVRQWADLRGQVADEKRDWVDQRERLSEDVRILTLERDALRATQADLDAEDSEAARLYRQREARRQELLDAADRLRPVLDRTEVHLRRLRAAIPPSLSREFDEGIRQLPGNGKEADGPDRPARRSQILAGLLSHVEGLQEGVHAVREILTLEGHAAREFEVLYLGLARGFALSPHGGIAAIGEPGSEGWHWQARPEWKEAIAEALSAQRSRDIRLVPLPLRFAEEAP